MSKINKKSKSTKAYRENYSIGIVALVTTSENGYSWKVIAEIENYTGEWFFHDASLAKDFYEEKCKQYHLV